MEVTHWPAGLFLAWDVINTNDDEWARMDDCGKVDQWTLLASTGPNVYAQQCPGCRMRGTSSRYPCRRVLIGGPYGVTLRDRIIVQTIGSVIHFGRWSVLAALVTWRPKTVSKIARCRDVSGVLARRSPDRRPAVTASAMRGPRNRSFVVPDRPF